MSPPDRARALECRTARAWIEADHVIYVTVRAGAEVRLEDAREHMALGVQLAAGHPYTLLLIDIAGMRSMSREARMYHASGGAEAQQTNTRAMAIVVNSPLTRAIANFFIGLNRPKTPLHMFADRQAALQWLRTFAD